MATGVEEKIEVGDVLHHLHHENDVEPAPLSCQVLGQGAAVIDVQAGLFGMELGDANVVLRRVDARHLGAEAPQGLAEKAAAAADIDDGEVRQRPLGPALAAKVGGDVVSNEAQAQRVLLVQGLELAVGVPPAFGHDAEPGDFVGRRGCLGWLRSGSARAGTGHGVHPACGCGVGLLRFANVEYVWAPAAVQPALQISSKNQPDASVKAR